MNLSRLLTFLHDINKLKSEFRHAWIFLDRKESVADHCWRVSFMVILLAPYLKIPINIEKALKMSIIHDLAEAKTGDTHLFEFLNNSILSEEKGKKEKKAMQKILSILPITLRKELNDLWIEFEEESTNEAKFVLAIDKLEAHIQHNEADFSTWTEEEINSVYSGYLDKYCDFNDYLNELKKLVLIESSEKIQTESNRKQSELKS